MRAVTLKDLDGGSSITVSAPYFIDATELGDLLPLAKVEYVTGAEARRDTGEPHAPAEARPADMQAFTCCFVVDYVAGEDHTIERPGEYAFWRDYVPAMTPPWPGRLLSWSMTDPITLKPRAVIFDPALQHRPGAAASTCGSTAASPAARTSPPAPTPAISRW